MDLQTPDYFNWAPTTDINKTYTPDALWSSALAKDLEGWILNFIVGEYSTKGGVNWNFKWNLKIGNALLYIILLIANTGHSDELQKTPKQIKPGVSSKT